MLGACADFCPWVRPRIVLVCRRLWPIATVPRSMRRGLGSTWLGHRLRSPRSPARRVGRRRSGAGSGASPRPASTACCARRPASRAASPDRRHGAPGGRADLGRAARRSDPLDRPRDGQDGRDLAALGAANLAGPPVAAAPHPNLQALDDPAFAAKLEAIVGLYIDRAQSTAIVLSVDEKSQIQALDRSQPGLPLEPGKAGARSTHDCQARRHRDPVRRARRARRHGDQPLHAAPPACRSSSVS